MLPRLEIDDSEVKRAVDELAAGLEKGFQPTLQEAAELAADDIDRHFLTGTGIGGEKLAPLKESTVRSRKSLRRRTGGRLPVAGDEDPLRVTDRGREAATATKAGVPGSAFKIDGKEVVVGIDVRRSSSVSYMRFATGTADGTGLPLRDPVELDAATEASVYRLFDQELERRTKALG